jgi:uncharacterized protein YuzE
MRFSYDEDADVMYIRFSESSSTTSYLENDNGDILRFDEATEKLVGVTIPWFKERILKGDILDIPEIEAIPFGSDMRKLINSRTVRSKNSALLKPENEIDL